MSSTFATYKATVFMRFSPGEAPGLSSACIEALLSAMAFLLTRFLACLYMYLPIEKCSREKSDRAVNKVISDYKSIGSVSVDYGC